MEYQEIKQIKTALHYWQFGNEQQFEKAEKILQKVWNKYGTVDITTIKQLIK